MKRRSRFTCIVIIHRSRRSTTANRVDAIDEAIIAARRDRERLQGRIDAVRDLKAESRARRLVSPRLRLGGGRSGSDAAPGRKD
ncbi:MAG: hypothetical protein IPM16_15015 [Chloroflexi bacterium]|nr:hypothetical protein [Chloroflexota bacterium]